MASYKLRIAAAALATIGILGLSGTAATAAAPAAAPAAATTTGPAQFHAIGYTLLSAESAAWQQAQAAGYTASQCSGTAMREFPYNLYVAYVNCN